MLLQKASNSTFDTLVHPELRLFSRAVPAFQLCGYVGLALAIALTQALVAVSGLAAWVMAAITLADVATFFALAMASKILTGAEVLIYYQHMIAVLLVTALLLWLLGQPLLPYVDVTILGVGVFVACGRVGCLMAGCCYGRPYRWGVRYGPAHVAAGFDPHLVGARLFPTQLIEAAWIAGVVLVGSALVLAQQPPGAALAWYIVTYGIGRFSLEFMRGDVARPYYGGFSEAQWVSLALLLALAGAEWAGLLPWIWWHSVAAAGLAVALLLVALRRRGDQRHRLLTPRHIAELAAALDRTPNSDATPAQSAIAVAATSENLQVSTGVLVRDQRSYYHYTFSQPGTPLSDGAAQAVAELIMRIRPPAGPYELVKGGHGVFHLIAASE